MDDEIWVLLHGTPLTPKVWDGTRPALEAVHRVAAPILHRPSRAEGAQAEIAGRVLSEVGNLARRFHVVGHSFGGQVAIELVMAAPRRTASLTLICTRSSPFPSFSAAAARLRVGGPLDVAATLERWFLPREIIANAPVVRYARRCLEHADRDKWADELDAIAIFDRRVDLGSITAPTSVIASELDRVGSPQEMAGIASAIPGAQFMCVENASHMSQFIDSASLAERIIGGLHLRPNR